MVDYSIQLWSVQNHLEKDFEGTLKALSEMGYTSVEFAGFYNHSAVQVAEILKKYNLKTSSAHCPIDDLVNNFDETVAFHKAIGNKNYVVPCYWMEKQEDIDRFVDIVTPIIPKLKAEGIELSYHNHAIELTTNDDGSLSFDQMFYRTELAFEIDIYWAYVSMNNPISLLKRAGKRLKLVHLKDGTKQEESCALGKGDTPVDEAFNYCIENNLPIVVEDEPPADEELIRAKMNIEYLRSLEN